SQEQIIIERHSRAVAPPQNEGAGSLIASFVGQVLLLASSPEQSVIEEIIRREGKRLGLTSEQVQHFIGFAKSIDRSSLLDPHRFQELESSIKVQLREMLSRASPMSLFGLMAAAQEASPGWVKFWSIFGFVFEVGMGYLFKTEMIPTV